MERYNIIYREGYVKAIMDISGLLERCEPGMKSLRANNIRGVSGLLDCILGDVDYFMEHTDMANFELISKDRRKTVFIPVGTVDGRIRRRW